MSCCDQRSPNPCCVICRQALLGELDELFIKQGSEHMSPQERSIAVKKLIECTGTRGATFALVAARDAVLMARRRHQVKRA
jgi:hypothetical protein